MNIYSNQHKEVFDDDFDNDGLGAFKGLLNGLKIIFISVFVIGVFFSLVLNGCERQKMINKNLADLEKRLDAEQPTKTIRF